MYFFDRCRIFLIQTIFFKDLHIYSPDICDLFLDIKMENGVLDKYKKDTRHKTGTRFITQP